MVACFVGIWVERKRRRHVGGDGSVAVVAAAVGGSFRSTVVVVVGLRIGVVGVNNWVSRSVVAAVVVEGEEDRWQEFG